MSLLGLGVLGFLVAAFVGRAFARGGFGVASQRDVVFEVADMAVILLVAHALVPWAQVGVWGWYVAIVAVGIGMFRLVTRYPTLPARRPGGRRALQATGSVIHAAILVVIAAVVIG